MDNIIVHNSKRYFFISIIMDVALFGCGVYLLFSNLYLLGIIGIIVSLFLIRDHSSSLKDRTPKVIISSTGIRTSLTGQKDWSDIINCKIIPKSSDSAEDGIEFYLRIEYLRGSEIEKSDILVDNLSVTRRRLKRIIKKYSNGRF